MNPEKSLIKKLPFLFMIFGSGLLAIYVLTATVFPTAGKHGRFLASTLADRLGLTHWVEIYQHAWHSVQGKVDQIRKAEEENARLRLENANLKLNLETAKFDCHSNHGDQATRNSKIKLHQDTGTAVGRTLASMSYRPPTDLVPSQLFTLGVSYMKAREDEKAAVIFSHLTSSEHGEAYRTSKNLLMTGVTWYRLENFKLADHYFDEVLKREASPETLPYLAQARLWKAIVAKRFNKELKVQYWLRELIDHHPHALEAKWVNPNEAEHAKDAGHSSH
jgi:TolA-binding protein